MKKLKMLVMVLPMMAMLSCEKECLDRKDKDENERQIAITELPKTVTEGIQAQFVGAELLEADEITQKNGSLTYDVEIKYSGSKMEVMYDAEGKYLGEEKDGEDGEDKD
ncbi:MAG: hypothetical protein SGJ15_09220 [Bacteroidota bacterium]|nr:hypothetical protein [Bacteroidota bacterium]